MGEVQSRTASLRSQRSTFTDKLSSQFPHFGSNKILLAQNQTYYQYTIGDYAGWARIELALVVFQATTLPNELPSQMSRIWNSNPVLLLTR